MNPFTYLGNGTDPERNDTEAVLAVQGSVVGLFLQTPNGTDIPISNSTLPFRLQIPNKERRHISVSNAPMHRLYLLSFLHGSHCF